MDRFIDKLMDAIGVTCVVLLAAFLFLGLPAIVYAMWHSANSPTFELRKDQWACTSAHIETSTMYVKVGEVLVPQTSNSSVCDQYSAQ